MASVTYARIAAVNMVLNKNISVDTLADGFCVSRGTVYAWLAAYDCNGLDGLADDARPGRPPFVPRAQLEEIVGGAKRFTALGFVELVDKRTGVKYSEQYGHRLLRSLGFAVKKTLRLADCVPPKEEVEIWQNDAEREVETPEKDDFTVVMAPTRATKTRTCSGSEPSTCAATPNLYRCRSQPEADRLRWRDPGWADVLHGVQQGQRQIISSNTLINCNNVSARWRWSSTTPRTTTRNAYGDI